MTITDPVHDIIVFAPNLERPFHILAIATKDKNFHIKTCEEKTYFWWSNII